MPNALSFKSTASPETHGAHSRRPDRKPDAKSVFADALKAADISKKASPGAQLDDEAAEATHAGPSTETRGLVVSEPDWRKNETAENDIVPAGRLQLSAGNPTSVGEAFSGSKSGGSAPDGTSIVPMSPRTTVPDVERAEVLEPTRQFAAEANSNEGTPRLVFGMVAEATTNLSHRQAALDVSGQSSVVTPSPGDAQKPKDPTPSRHPETESVENSIQTVKHAPEPNLSPSVISADVQIRQAGAADAFSMDDGSSSKEAAADQVGPQEIGSLRSARDPIGMLAVSGAAARAEMARAIAGQMAAAITSKPGSGRVEIALNPEELGKVSIILTGREDGFHLVLSAERPETLDLMRRHIGILTAELQDMGFGDLSFDLGTSGEKHQNETRPGRTAFLDPEGLDNSEAGRERQLRAAPMRALDLRL